MAARDLTRLVCKLFLGGLLAAPVQVFAQSPNPSESVTPPRTIADIAAVLEQYKPDPAKVEAAKVEASREAPANARTLELKIFYQRRADARESLGLSAQMLEDRRKLLELSRGDDDETRMKNQLAVAEASTGNFATALKLREEIVSDRHAQPGARLSASYQASMLYSLLGDVASAKNLLSRGDAAFDSIRNHPQAQSYLSLISAMREWARAALLTAQGKYLEANAALRRTVTFYEEDLKIAAARVRSDPSTATPVALVRGGLDISESELAINLVALGRLAEAELVARNVLQRTLSRVGKYAPTTAIATGRFAYVLNEQGRFREAQVLAEAALDILEKSGVAENSVVRLGARKQLGNALLGREDWAGAHAQYRATRTAAEVDEYNRRFIRGSSESGLAGVKAGEAQSAVKGMQALLDESLANLGPNHYQSGEVRGVLAMALAATGQRADALREFGEAVRVLLAPGAAVEAEGLALRRVKLRAIVESYMALLWEIRGSDVERNARIDVAAESFRLADALRGGSVQQSLAASGARAAANQPGLGDLIRKEQDQRQETQALYDILLRLVALPLDKQLPKVTADMRARIGQLEKERARLYADIEKRFPDYANLIHPRPATLEQARRALRPGEALVSILSTSEQTFVWAVNGAGAVSFHAARLSERDIAAIVAGLRQSLDPEGASYTQIPAFDVAAAFRLYAELLAPAEGVWGSATTLYASAGGALGQIPLAVLPTRAIALEPSRISLFEEYRRVAWLARRLAITDVPSVTAFVRLRGLPPASAQRAPFVGFGDPQFGQGQPVATVSAGQMRRRNLQLARVTSQTDAVKQELAWTAYGQLTPLPDTREEVLAIASALGADSQKDVFLGLEANKRRVMTMDLNRQRIVAFATHGLIPGDLPGLTQPALALAVLNDAKESPLLTLDDVLALKLDADWVVLSACNTAAGDGQGAEAVSGLGRAFFYAGSRALLVTHWPVETVSARLLTTGIFERYAKDPAITRAQALNASMLAVMEGGQKDASGNLVFSYAHPMFWAPYALIGDGGR